MDLQLRGPEYLPLRTFRDDDLLDQGSDPLISVIGSLSDLEEGERVVSRIKLASLGPDWSSQHLEKTNPRPAYDPNTSPATAQVRLDRTNAATMTILALLALPALRAYFWIQSGETWKAVLLGLGVASLAAFAGWAWWRIKKARSGGKYQDPLLIKEKVSRTAYEAQVEVTAILSEHGVESRARELLRNAASAYKHYDNPAGASFRATKMRPALPIRRAVAACEGSAPEPERAGGAGAGGPVASPGSRGRAAHGGPLRGAGALPLEQERHSGGAHVGNTVGSRPRNIHFQEDTLRRHHLYVARTRMGKSTLMEHIVAHKMREKAAGRDQDAIVVIDPHADLVKALLKHVPEGIVDRVRLIDLGDDERAPGINLLDARVFTDRDRTADSVVRVAHGVWEQWGPRMQSILEHTVKSLHEYNRHPDTGEEEQLTILDGLRMLSDVKFRNRVLRRVDDPYVVAWWGRDLLSWNRTTRSDALAPVQTRLAYYASSKKARAILGQPRSTIDLRETIRGGGVLLVSTAQGDVGQDVSALVGASLLNLVDSVIREQGSLPMERRRGALVVVDEMQSIPGVDYEGMLGELGKFGASFILATQSLARLAELSPTMQDTLLANVGCLVAFQVAAADARYLIGELDRERVTEEDLVSLPVHHCYVRATAEGQRQPTYTMEVREPEAGDPEAEERVRAAMADYTVPAETIASQDAEAERLLAEFRKKLEEEEEREDEDGGVVAEPAKPSPKPSANGASTTSGKAKKKRPRRRKERGSEGDVREGASASDGGR